MNPLNNNNAEPTIIKKMEMTEASLTLILLDGIGRFLVLSINASVLRS
jgi:hypothetical protein